MFQSVPPLIHRGTTGSAVKLNYVQCVIKCGSKGGGVQGVRTPWKITSYMGLYSEITIGPPGKKLVPPWKILDPLFNLEK